jgi:GT2 family glycosyltransferase
MTDPQPETQPDFSVIIPFWKSRHYVCQAIESILDQTYKGPVEIIIVDDGSPENIRDLPERYPGIRVLRKENGGVGPARHYGTLHARGKYLCYLDDDDLYLPDKLRREAWVMERHPEVDWTFANSTRFQDDDDYVKDFFKFFPALWQAPHTPLNDCDSVSRFERGALLRPFSQGLFTILPQTMCLRREFVLEKCNWEPKSRLLAEDVDMYYRMAALGTAACINVPVARIRRHHGRNQTNDMLEAEFKMQIGWLARLEQYPPELREQLEPWYAVRAASVGYMAYERKDFRNAAAQYADALKHGHRKPAVLAKWALSKLRSLTQPAPAEPRTK